MTETDVFAKLSRIIETQDFSDGERSVEGLLESYNTGGSTKESTPPHGKDRDHVTFEESVVSSKHPQSVKQNNNNQYYARPTPYDVWKADQDAQFKFKERPTKKLSENQWDNLVDHLHTTNRMKESALMKEQNQGLAAELDGLSFKPQMNNTSLQLASTMKSLQHRLPGLISKREAHLKKRKEEIAKEEMEQCTFAPDRVGGKVSEKYLNRMGRGKPTPEDFFQYHKEKLKRNDQRKQIMEEIESRELTFKPQSNSRSQKLQQRMAMKQSVVVDPKSRVTVSVRRDVTDRNTENSTTALDSSAQTKSKPSISEVGQSYKKNSDKPVHERLYQRAVELNIKKHNNQVEQLTGKLNVTLFPWEKKMRSPRVQNAWTMNKSHLAKSTLNVEHCIDDINKPVTVVEYDESIQSIWRALRGVEPSKHFVNKLGGGDDSTLNPAEL